MKSSLKRMLDGGKNTSSLILTFLFSFCCAFQAQAEWGVVDQASVVQGKPVYVRGMGYYTDNHISVAQHNLDSEQIRLVILDSSHPVTNADGTTSGGLPFFSITNIDDTIRIYFGMQRARFSYTSQLQQSVDTGVVDPTVTLPITFDNASVHDPSVIKLQDGDYWVFGSHLAAARSPDLVNWYSVASDGAENSPFFDTYAEEAAEGIAWSGGTIGSWAADVIQLEDGRYYFYYNHCASPDTGLCDASRSYLGLAVSDTIDGPYTNLGLILRSGHVGNENPGIDGETYNGNVHPNAIDPDTFFDKEGRLWMVYGSYSGGIFIMEMDPQTGFPFPDQGYGTKIMGGFYSAIEGPYMLYSPESDYYYLFTSFGGYEQEDGYNMRIARSRSPQGPFLDAQGIDMIAASGGWSNIEPYGVKFMGGHVFKSRVGEPGTDHGYMAPGHNSAFYDENTGKHFVILHTRFPDRGEGHEIRVHEMYINADGWLVASPHRYVPIEGENIVDEQDLIGVYQFVNHEKDINRTAKISSYLSLNADGTIGGSFSGNYVLGDTNQITLNIAQLGTFEGVMAWQWNDNIQQLVPTFSALASSGVTVWGTQMPNTTVAQALQAIEAELQLPTQATSSLSLPILGALGATITWQSSDDSTINLDGVVVRPLPGESDAVVTLTATVELNGESVVLTFDVQVPARKPLDRIAFYQFDNTLTDSLEILPDAQVVGNTLTEPGGDLLFSNGELNQAVWLDGSTGIRLPDGLIYNNAYTVSMWLNPTELTQFSSAFFGAVALDNWISLVPLSWDQNTMLWRGSQAWYDGSAGFAISTDRWSHVAFTVESGTIRLYIDGNEVFSGDNFNDLFSGQSAVFSLGVNYWDLPFRGLIDELAIYDVALSRTELVALDIDRRSISELIDLVVDNILLGDLDSVREDLRLPSSSLFASAISWQSDNTGVIDNQGRITRPGAGQSDATATLTATILLDGQQRNVEYLVTVKSLSPIQPIAEFNFDNMDLSDAQGNFASGVPTGDRILVDGFTAEYTGGVNAHALALNGTNGVRLPNNLITDNSYSVSMWLNPTEFTAFSSAFFGYSSPDSWTSVVPLGGDFVPHSNQSLLWSGTQWYDAPMGQRIAANQWSHVVYTVDNGNVRIYLNGAIVFEGTGFPDVFSAGETGFGIAVNFWDTPFHGSVDELRIYDQAISTNDVQQLYGQLKVPVAEFNFDHMDLSDAQGNFANGVPTEGVILTDGNPASFTDGVKAQALWLDGSNGVRLPNDIITDNSYSVSLWLNPSELTAFTSAFFAYSTPDSWVSVVPLGGDFVPHSSQSLVWSGTQWYDAPMGAQIAINQWSHIVYVVNNGNITIYLNSESVFQGTGFPDVLSGNETGFGIGVNFWDIPFNGLVDEVKIFDDAVTLGDVQSLYLDRD